MVIDSFNQGKASRTIQQRSNDAGGSHIVDNRQSGSRNYLSGAPLQRLEEEEEENPLQGKMEDAPRRNETGLPDNLKAGVESLSGYSLDDVRVHYNSSKPATVQALAYTQGTDIHVAPGQEKHLPHEAWHVAQQMAGRVSPTTNINGMPVNDNAALEHEADDMGEKALKESVPMQLKSNKRTQISSGTVKQLKLAKDRLNVVGEDHPESDPRREDEIRFVTTTIPGGDYWREHEFRTVSGYGDTTELRFLNRFAVARDFEDKYYKIFAENILAYWEDSSQQAQECVAGAKIHLQSILPKQICSRHLDQCRIEIRNNPSFLSSRPELRTLLLSELTSVYNIALSVEIPQSNFQTSLDWQALCNHIIMFNNKMESLQERIGKVDSRHIAFLRSVRMHLAANENSTLRGVWKVGDEHRKDIEKMSRPEDREYNLMSRAEFNEEYDSLMQRLLRFFNI